jgi:tetratricopeptide (TPR) repeat protein
MLRPDRLLAVLLAGASLSACAATSAITPAEIEAATARPGQAYGDYLSGHAALAKGERGEAARYYARAVTALPEDGAIRQRAFVTALLSGDVTRAAALAPAEDGADQRLGRLVRGVEALAAGKGPQAVAELSTDGVGYPHRAAAALVRPFAQAAAGDLASATAPVAAGRDRLLPVFGELGRAMLLERAKRHDEAEGAYKAVLAQSPENDLFLRLYGEFLERRGRRAEAAEQYRAGLKGETDDVDLARALTRATARRASPPPMPDLRQGAAQGLLASAANLVAEEHEELGLAYLRLTLRLDPDRDEAWLLVGDLLNEAKDRGGAREAYARVRAGTGDYAAAQGRLAWSWQQEGNTAEALRAVDAAVAASPGSESLQLTRAEILRASDRMDEAAALLTAAIAKRTEPDWRLHYLRGTAYERAGRWPEAEADLLKALELRPDEADILNYLGYAWADRGERLDQAFAMIEKAVALKPQSGAIVDSLGWAHYRLGRHAEAVKHLERAVELEPADPTINDHLGDAYWRVGRRTEAQFQWRRVLTLEPEAKLQAEAETKLASGLGAAPVATAAKP